MSQVTENKVISAPVPMTPLQEFWHYFKRNKGAVVGLVYVVIVLFIAIFANWIAPYNPAEQFRDALLAPPAWQEGGSMAHLLGTDDVGRDVLSRLMYGARLSLLVGCLVVVLSLIMGVILGLIAGYFGGLVDNIIMRVVDVFYCIPSMPVIIIIGVILIVPLTPVLEAPVLEPAFAQMLPALFGGLGVAFVSRNWKIAVAPVVLMLVLFIFVPALNAGTVGIMVPVSVLFTIAVSRLLYKRGVL